MSDQTFIFLLSIICLSTLSVILIFMYLVRHRAEVEKNSKSSPQVNEPRNIAVSCPHCHKPMTTGYSVAAKGIMWRKSSEQPIGFFTMGSRLLKNTMNYGFIAKENRAWQCDACSYLMIDFSEMIPIKTHKKK